MNGWTIAAHNPEVRCVVARRFVILHSSNHSIPHAGTIRGAPSQDRVTKVARGYLKIIFRPCPLPLSVPSFRRYATHDDVAFSRQRRLSVRHIFVFIHLFSFNRFDAAACTGGLGTWQLGNRLILWALHLLVSYATRYMSTCRMSKYQELFLGFAGLK